MLPPATAEILGKLNDDELKKFGLLLKSPYFNSIEILPKMFEIIKSARPKLSSSSLSIENMFQKLYPGKEFKEQTIRNLYSELGKLLKTFITIEALKSDDVSFNLYYMAGLRQKKSFELSNKAAEKNREKITAEFGTGCLKNFL